MAVHFRMRGFFFEAEKRKQQSSGAVRSLGSEVKDGWGARTLIWDIPNCLILQTIKRFHRDAVH